MLTLPPVVNLVTVLLSQAIKQNATAIQFAFAANQEQMPVPLKKQGTWTDAAQIPAELARPLRGVIARFQGLGYNALSPRLKSHPPMPTKVTILWPNENLLEIHVESSPTAPT
jgi:hypothetical protein